MKIVVAPDSFKGSLNAQQAAKAIDRGIRRAHPDVQTVLLPVADGGEGTLGAILEATGGEKHVTEVTGPLGAPVSAAFGVLPDKTTAVIEMAQAAGLHLAPKTGRDPRRTTTYGVGELINYAVQSGAKRIIIGIGGSCTNDGGAGAMQALGAQFLDAQGSPLRVPITGADLSNLSSIDLSDFRFPVGSIDVVVASDVTNPLIGTNGASAIYGPQKGATAEIVRQLDDALAIFASIVYRDMKVSIADLPGAGAAGGLGGGLTAFLNAEMKSGIDLVLDTIGFDAHVREADYVFTGEGRIDEQTLQGKVIAGVLSSTKKFDVPVVAFGGSIELSAEQLLSESGLLAAVPIVSGVMTLDFAIANAAILLEAASFRTTRLLMSASSH